jgi:hypothetical protein
MRRLRTPSILGALLTGALLLGASPASAQVTIAVSPALLELNGHAGDTGSIEVTVSNSGDEAFDVVTAITVFQDMTGDRSAVAWSKVSPDRLSLKPGANVKAEYSIGIPKDARSGGRYAAISFTTLPPGANDSTSVAGRILVPVLLTVEAQGDLIRTPVLDTAALFLEQDGRLGARVAVRNDGNVHVPLTGTVVVSSQAPKADAKLGIPMGRVLPGATRTYQGDATLPLPLGSTYDVTVAMGQPATDGTMGDAVINDTFQVDATPALQLSDAAICENLDRGPAVAVTMTDPGSLGVVPTVGFEVLDAAGVPVGSAMATDQPLAWPGETYQLAADLQQRLASGSYTLVAGARYGTNLTTETRLPFSIGGDPATAAPLCAADTASPQPSH